MFEGCFVGSAERNICSVSVQETLCCLSQSHRHVTSHTQHAVATRKYFFLWNILLVELCCFLTDVLQTNSTRSFGLGHVLFQKTRSDLAHVRFGQNGNRCRQFLTESKGKLRGARFENFDRIVCVSLAAPLHTPPHNPRRVLIENLRFIMLSFRKV